MTDSASEPLESSITLHIATLTFLGRIFGRVVRTAFSTRRKIVKNSLSSLVSAAELATSLRDANIPEQVLPRLADEAAAQWSGRFSSRHFDAPAALEIYRAAY